MFFLSKVGGALIEPATLFFLLTAVGGGLLWRRRWARLGRALVALALLLAAVTALVPIDRRLARMLEDRIPAPAVLPERIDGIVVLGGGINAGLSAARGRVAFNSAAARLTEVPDLLRRYPEARLVFTGGSGALLSPEASEAPHAVRFLAGFGIDPTRIEVESQARNTRENALLAKVVAAPRPGEVWILVTSALHMPRAMGCFHAVGWPVIPWPVDYLTRGDGADWAPHPAPLDGLTGLGPVLHELVGLAVYRLRGWTDTLLPP